MYGARILKNTSNSARPRSLMADHRASFAISIADLTIGLTSDDPLLAVPPNGAMTPFLVHEVEPDIQLQARWGKLDGVSGGEQLFESGGLWHLAAENGSLRFSFTSPVLGPLPYKIALLDKEFKSGEVLIHRPYVPPSGGIYPLQYPLDELLLIHLLAAGRGVEVHACGVVDSDGRGYLFAGQSGAGKTTMARLWQKTNEAGEAGGLMILSDDRIVLRYQAGQFWMYGTPWHGEAELSSPARAPLNGIYLLRHGSRNKLVPLRRSATAARLLACSFPLFYDPSGLGFTLGFFDQLVQAVPCYELSFTPDERVLALVRSS
jgi:hypothetical protein